MARPKLRQMDAELAKAGLLMEGCLLAHFDNGTEAAIEDLEKKLHDSERSQVRDLAQKAQERAQHLWDSAILGGSAPDNTATPMARWEPVADEDTNTSPPAAYTMEDESAEVDDEEAIRERRTWKRKPQTISAGHHDETPSPTADSTNHNL